MSAVTNEWRVTASVRRICSRASRRCTTRSPRAWFRNNCARVWIETKAAFSSALDALRGDLDQFDITLAAALATSRRKIEYQVGKIARKTATQIMARDEQAMRDARSLNGLVFPEKHLQERLYSIVPFIAKFGPGLVDELYTAVRIDCPDHQFVVV